MRAIVHDRYGPPGGAPARGGRAARTGRRRGPRPGPRHHGQPHGLPLPRRAAVRLALLRRPAAAEAADPRQRARGRGRGGRVRPSPQFAVGDAVFGVSPGRFGAHAEYVCVRESAALAHKPSGMSFEEAAAVCDGAIIGAHVPADGGPAAGQRILVYGASGSIGTAAVQLARHFGAHVTAVCDTKNVELVRSLGADEVVDYTASATSRRTARRTTSSSTPSASTPSPSCRRSIRPGGVFVPTELGRLMVENLLLTLVHEAARQASRAVRGRPVVEARRSSSSRS